MALKEGSAQRFLDLDCERVHYSAGFGVCLSADPTLKDWFVPDFNAAIEAATKKAEGKSS